MQVACRLQLLETLLECLQPSYRYHLSASVQRGPRPLPSVVHQEGKAHFVAASIVY